MPSKKLDDLLIGEFFATNWAELLGKTGQALVAGSMAALKGTCVSLLFVVAFQADVASGLLVFFLFFKGEVVEKNFY